MTHTTEQERALADLRHLYAQMVGGLVKDSAQAKRIADGILSRAIQKLEQAARRAQAVLVQQGLREAAQRAPDWMDSQADSQSKGNYHSFDLLCLRQERDALAEALAAAPQPPEADHIAEAGKMVEAPMQVFSHMEARPKHNSFSNEPMRAVAVDTMGREMPHYDPSRAALPPPEAAQSNSAEFDGIKTKAAPVQLPEPDSYCFQHEETGLTEYVDAQQVEWGFEKNNPRWKRVGAAYSEQQVRQILAAHGIKEQST